MTIRVQIPVYTDRWMMGDRYGVLIKTTKRPAGKQRGLATVAEAQIAHVKLDKSGKTIKVLLDDCQWVSS
jgi:hypothetical protein